MADGAEVAFEDDGALFRREIRNWRRLKSNPSRLRFTPSEGGCIRQISSSVHSLRGWRKGATEEAGALTAGLPRRRELPMTQEPQVKQEPQKQQGLQK